MMERLASVPNNIKHFPCGLRESNKFCLIQTFFFFLNACLRSAFDDIHLQQNLWCGSIFLMILSGLLHCFSVLSGLVIKRQNILRKLLKWLFSKCNLTEPCFPSSNVFILTQLHSFSSANKNHF